MNPAAVQPALELRDIHLPGAPSLWPPAPGWWLLAVLVVALLAFGIPTLLRRRHIRLQRERLLAEFSTLQAGLAREQSPQALANIGELLRRLALERYPRGEVAALNGGAWLRFLDATGGAGGFADGPGRVLADGPYRRRLAPDFDAEAFVALVRGWVEKNADRPWRPEDEADGDNEPRLGFVR